MLKSLTTLCICLPLLAAAQQQDHASPYAGMQARDISSLSAEDIAELRRGGGWGLALPAELNSRPGPAHLLELREELDLNADQIAQLERIEAQMRAEAIAAGEVFIAAEAALDAAFASDDLAEADLRQLVEAAEQARAELRIVHLSRHLLTPALLTPQQIALYDELRGYGDDPCGSVPAGHDPEMWRRHNGCD